MALPDFGRESGAIDYGENLQEAVQSVTIPDGEAFCGRINKPCQASSVTMRTLDLAVVWGRHRRRDPERS